LLAQTTIDGVFALSTNPGRVRPAREAPAVVRVLTPRAIVAAIAAGFRPPPS
jgi:hypothetical protein